MGEHKTVSLHAGDHVIFSSRVIPGNEKSVAHLIAHCHLQGVEVTTTRQNPNIHVSGHAYQEDLEILIKNLQPKQYIPVHGTHTQLLANGTLKENSIVVSNGSFFELNENSIDLIGEFDLKRRFVDSWSHRPMNYEEMRLRHKIGDSGLLLLSGSEDELEIEFFGIPFDDGERQSCSQGASQNREEGSESCG